MKKLIGFRLENDIYQRFERLIKNNKSEVMREIFKEGLEIYEKRQKGEIMDMQLTIDTALIAKRDGSYFLNHSLTKEEWFMLLDKLDDIKSKIIEGLFVEEELTKR